MALTLRERKERIDLALQVLHLVENDPALKVQVAQAMKAMIRVVDQRAVRARAILAKLEGKD